MTNLQSAQIAIELFGAVFCLIAAFIVFATRRYDQKGAVILTALFLNNAVLCISEAGAYYFRGNTSRTGFYMVRITNYVVFFLGYVLVWLGAQYIDNAINKRGGKPIQFLANAIHVVCAIGIVLLTVSQFVPFYYSFDAENRYYRLPGYPPLVVLPLIVLMLLFIRVLRHRKRFKGIEQFAFLVFIFFPVLSLVLTIFFYGFSFSTITNTIAIFLFFAAYEAEYADAMVEREREMAEERLSLYQSQIQPHFIYNSLTTLRSYLPEGSEARELLNHFTRFLRGSADLLTEAECVPAKREFQMVTDYLSVEKRRFGDQLKVINELQDDDFMIPPFTIQSLVENAIRYGIRERDDGRGTLTLRSYLGNDVHVVEVIDDGVGFDAERVMNEELLSDADGRRHTGLSHLKKRLAYMCDATIEITSTIGAGSSVRVSIPVVR